MRNSTKKMICAIMLVIMVAGTALAYAPTYLTGVVTATHDWKYFGGIAKQSSGKVQYVTFSEGYSTVDYFKVKPQVYIGGAYTTSGSVKRATTDGIICSLVSDTTIDAGVSTRVGYTLDSSNAEHNLLTSDRAYIRYDYN